MSSLTTPKKLARNEYRTDWQTVRRRKDQETSLNKKRHVKERHGIVKTRQQIQADYRAKKESQLALTELRAIFRALHLVLRIELVDKKYKGEVGIFNKRVVEDRRLARQHHSNHHQVVCVKYPHDEEYREQRKEVKIEFAGTYETNQPHSVSVLIKVQHRIHQVAKDTIFYEEWFLLERPFGKDGQPGYECCNFTLNKIEGKELARVSTKIEKENENQKVWGPHQYTVNQEIQVYAEALQKAEMAAQHAAEMAEEGTKQFENDRQANEASLPTSKPSKRRGWSKWWERDDTDEEADLYVEGDDHSMDNNRWNVLADNDDCDGFINPKAYRRSARGK